MMSANCPSCGGALKKVPQRKTKCPHCGEYMCVRTMPGDGSRRVVTAAVAEQIDREWDGRASKTVTLAMPYAQAVQLFVDGLRWGIVRREAGADDAAQEQDCSGYCVAGPITDNRDGTLSIKMGSYTQLEQALRELEEALT